MCNKEKFTGFLLTLFFTFVFLMNTDIIEGKAAAKIPDEMEPCTIIVYDDSEHYTIIQGGEAKEKNLSLQMSHFQKNILHLLQE